MNYLKGYSIQTKDISFPIYFPDATRGVIRSLDSQDLRKSNVEGVVVNSYHLMSKPGQTVLKSLGGIKNFMHWDGLVVSDSGGFQLLSLVYENSAFGKIDDEGITFYRDSKGKKSRHILTPEKSIQIQFNLCADIMICLDDCPSVKATQEDHEKSVKRTIDWAGRSMDEYKSQLKNRQKHLNPPLSPFNKGGNQIPPLEKGDFKPLLFAVIHGGNDRKLREQCAKELVDIGFNGYCFGGWPLDNNKELNRNILSLTASLMPDDLPKFALGVGNPKAIVDCVKMGYTIFDCVLPTRDARHKRLYVFTKDPNEIDIFNDEKITDFAYVTDEKYVRDPRPISQYCDCWTCQNYSRSYIKHLFEIEDTLSYRLATIHNLRTYTKLIEILRKNV
jgi:queuine tRNA-ribosyltransferase